MKQAKKKKKKKSEVLKKNSFLENHSRVAWHPDEGFRQQRGLCHENLRSLKLHQRDMRVCFSDVNRKMSIGSRMSQNGPMWIVARYYYCLSSSWTPLVMLGTRCYYIRIHRRHIGHHHKLWCDSSVEYTAVRDGRARVLREKRKRQVSFQRSVNGLW